MPGRGERRRRAGDHPRRPCFGRTAPPGPAGVDTSTAPLDPTKLDSYIKVGGDGTITAFTSKIELGQGNQTALSQIIAEELDVPLSSIDLIMGDTARSIQEFGTDGSRTI